MARLTIPVRLRWSDTDGYQHVNNAKMLTLLEEVRIVAFSAATPDATASSPTPGPLQRPGGAPVGGAARPGRTRISRA